MNFASVVAQNESVQLRSATIGPNFRVVSRFDLAPLQGASLRGGRFPGLKPWAESWSPFGAKAMRDALPTAPTTRKYWDRTLNRYKPWAKLSWPFGPWSSDISKDGFRAAAQSVAKELGGLRRGSRWQTAACGERRSSPLCPRTLTSAKPRRSNVWCPGGTA